LRAEPEQFLNEKLSTHASLQLSAELAAMRIVDSFTDLASPPAGDDSARVRTYVVQEATQS
jgi:hypothetical protein